MMKRHILCYGDSNTFGTDPVHGGRHPDSIRWTGVLQERLGEQYRIIEEGCGGRTTVFDDALSPGRNGLTALTTCIASHNPLDLIIVMLGTNDLKKQYSLTEWDLGRAMERIIDAIRNFPYHPYYQQPEILIVSPIRIREGVSKAVYGCFTEEAPVMSGHFCTQYEAVSREKGCHFFDAARVAEASEEDRLHMTAENHRKLAEALEAEVRKILEK
ncbi:MAG: SGNH/GDSL hydrolase family protein [Clostridiales bacterium]|nr:SGNH/GDSL hydrolase family protein [Clostridiales bacterium]